MMGYLENSVRIANEEVIDDNWWSRLLIHYRKKKML